MPSYQDMTPEQLKDEKKRLECQYAQFKAKGLALNMARGKPAKAQLDLSQAMLDVLNSESNLCDSKQTDCRNYGILDGIPEAKELMAFLLDDTPDHVIVCGNASLNIMYDMIARCWMFGTLGNTPWSKLDKVKWLCPVPGYDRHFAITESFGIEMIPVAMTDEGPNMDEVEYLVKNDAAIKGIWCVPKYSNPGGETYSDEVVERLAQMDCAADDFRIFWDNAYAVHHLSCNESEQATVKDIHAACKAAGNPDRVYKFGSTSKISFPGAGISALAASTNNIAEIKSRMSIQTIGHDKLNQLRHVRFFKNAEGMKEHMKKHAQIIAPKFDLVLRKLDEDLAPCGLGTWSHPKGGYFISYNAPEGCAKRIVTLAKEAGVTMTAAGATWPHKQDPKDSNIRIAPTLPPLEELEVAMDVFICCVKLAALERLGA